MRAKSPIAHRTAREIQIVVVDDHTFMRELIAARLSRETRPYKVVAEVGDSASAISACETFLPDLLILDINLPDRSGIEAVPEIKRVSPSTAVLLCTAYCSEDWISRAMQSGAEGFVEKTNTWDDFINAVNHISCGERYFRSKCPKPPAGPPPLQIKLVPEKVQVSPREREVIALLAEGKTSKEIAGKLFVGVQTVETHRRNVMSKLGVRNVAGLVSSAFRKGLIEIPQH